MNDRERGERLLSILRSVAARPVGGCLDDKEFVEFALNSYKSDEIARIEQHLVSCERCLALAESLSETAVEAAAYWDTEEGRTRIAALHERILAPQALSAAGNRVMPGWQAALGNLSSWLRGWGKLPPVPGRRVGGSARGRLVLRPTAAVLAAVLFMGAGAGGIALLDSFATSRVTLVLGNAWVKTLDDRQTDDYISIPDVVAADSLRKALLLLGVHPGEDRWIDSKHFEPPVTKGAVIAIGGPTVNAATRHYLKLLRHIDPRDSATRPTRGFMFVTPPQIPQGAFSETTKTSEVGIRDIETGELCSYDSLTDCALVVVGKDTTVRAGPILIVAGYSGVATERAAYALTRQESPLGRRLAEIFRREGYAEAVISIRRGAEPTFHEFRNVTNPRGR